MRRITPALTSDIKRYVGEMDVGEADAFPVLRFQDLVKHIARLSVLNKDYVLLYRGQGRDYRNKAGRTSLYPSIYRGSRLTSVALDSLFANLKRAATKLRDLIRTAGLEGQDDASKRLVLWSLLKHYEVCATPLLDFTSSVRVACSFALHAAAGKEAFVFVCGLPYSRGRISLDSEHDLINVRLLGICPPDALRPVFQEGYLAKTYEVASDYQSKDTLDFNRRLIAKFMIPTEKSFWGTSASIVPRQELYPADDPLCEIAEAVRDFLGHADVVGPGQVGHFLETWTVLEQAVIGLATLFERVPKTMSNALRVLGKNGAPEEFLRELDHMRRTRNLVVHERDELSPEELRDAVTRIPLLTNRVSGYYSEITSGATF